MPSAYPAALDDFVNPGPGDALDSPPHHRQHAHVNDAVAAVQAKLGTDGSADESSIDYLLKAATSPGHRHAAGEVDGLAAVATTGGYGDLSGRPALGTAAAQSASAFEPAITTLPVAKGGTGLGSLGGAYEILRVNAGGTAYEHAALPAATPGGTDGQAQFNNGGTFGGMANVTYTTNELKIQAVSGYYPLTVYKDAAVFGAGVAFQVAPDGSARASTYVVTDGIRVISYGAYMGVLGGQRFVFNSNGIDAYGPGPLRVNDEDIEVMDAARGVVIRSPNGTRWRLKVSDAGVVSAAPA